MITIPLIINILSSAVRGLSNEPVAESTFGIFFFFNSAFIISPFSFISNSPISSLKIYPCGAIVSFISYRPIGNTTSLPSFLDINTIFISLLISSNPFISIVAPSTISPVVKSVLLKVNCPSFLLFSIFKV